MTNTPQKNDEFLVFEPFVRTKFPVLICLFGFSGCGKTKSALLIAQGLGGKTMFMDTETGRGRVYAKDAVGFDGVPFGYTEMTPPFTPERYIAAIKQVEKAGFDNLIIDSGSHEWDGLGGMLEIAEANVDSKGKKRMGLGKWSVKSRHKTFMNSMMAGRMNILICLRAKDKYIERFVDGKKEIVMDGFVPLQERNFKYDMMIQLPMPEDAEGRFLMDRNKGFKCPGELLPHFKAGEQITPDVGKQIKSWIETGAAVDELLRQLKLEAMEHAEQGVDHFRDYWKNLERESQLKLKPFMANYESAARTADLEKEVDDEEPFTLNAAGTDIRSIQAPAAPLPEMETPNIRNAEHMDWWLAIDGLTSEMNKCLNLTAYNKFLGDYEPAISRLDGAPEEIRRYWQKVTVATLSNIAQKFAA